MHDVENNIDDLFRRAVDNYRLKPGESHWESIAPQLTGNEIIPAATNKKNHTKKYAGLSLLLLTLLIAAGILTKNIVNTDEIAGLSKSSEKNKSLTESNGVYQKQSEQKESIAKINHPVEQNEQLVNNSKAFIKEGKITNRLINKNEMKITETVPPFFTDDINKDAPQEVIANTKKDSQNSYIKQNSSSNVSRNQIPADTHEASKVSPPAGGGDIEGAAHHIYLGVVAGPAFNEVKDQGLGKTGFDIGIIAGYQANCTASVETGLLFTKKYYYSDGKYFNMSKMPLGMKVLSLHGSSSVFEIPVKLKYNVLHKNKINIFSSAGISSYILTNEKNNYHAVINGTTQDMKSVYKNSSGYFAAAVDISVGYEHKISNRSNLRIEPYVQIPLKGIGVGAMPVTSTGLHISFTRSVH